MILIQKINSFSLIKKKLSQKNLIIMVNNTGMKNQKKKHKNNKNIKNYKMNNNNYS